MILLSIDHTSCLQASGVDNTSRRKWDRQEFLERARKREVDQQARRNSSRDDSPPGEKKPLKHRDFEVDLTARLGKTQVITQVAPLDQQAGYFCSVCNCIVKDSANYLDHINGKKHQKALGMSMRVERSTLEQVQTRFETVKRKKAEGGLTDEGTYEMSIQFEMRMLKQQREEEERKRQRKERKKEKKREKALEDAGGEVDDPEVAQAMGFGGFGMKK
ncbi:hypothetical protein SELMODRAFT_181740 [Selaginella moellendorffii]|uniref:U1-type domain-containing protein n=1 Tax=Selaginella moellendorffii TaxID=88036 RepID=D8SQ43_SELML|nr:hypothetical protein SELMODRAFT_181740 [Selaginella moellendorffii]